MTNKTPMKWEYQVIIKETLGEFIDALNLSGNEGWEAISGTYSVGTPQRVSVGGGATVERAGTLQWAAVLKRSKQ